jgi:hypothetical protein
VWLAIVASPLLLTRERHSDQAHRSNEEPELNGFLDNLKESLIEDGPQIESTTKAESDEG